MSARALAHVRRAINGEIEAIVPYTALIGAHHVLTAVYGYSTRSASELMTRFMDASRIHWYRKLDEPIVRGGFDRASDANIDAWDGYYAEIARREGVETILTLDDDFERVDSVRTEVILTPDEFAELTGFLGV